MKEPLMKHCAKHWEYSSPPDRPGSVFEAYILVENIGLLNTKIRNPGLGKVSHCFHRLYFRPFIHSPTQQIFMKCLWGARHYMYEFNPFHLFCLINRGLGRSFLHCSKLLLSPKCLKAKSRNTPVNHRPELLKIQSLLPLTFPDPNLPISVVAEEMGHYRWLLSPLGLLTKQ